jgi:large subunit ribosomal protein L14
MIQLGTNLIVADNSGAKTVRCIHVLGGSKRRYASLGDIVVAVVKTAEPRRDVKRHDVVRALVVRQAKEQRRKDGSYIRFDDNACIILDGKTKNAKGNRISGPVAREVKEKGFDKVAAMAREII